MEDRRSKRRLKLPARHARSAIRDPRSSGLFIIGTDTGVGKTFVASALARALRERGVDVGVMKPIETGCRLRKGKLHPADGTILKRAAGVGDAIDRITPIRYRAPVAPWVAAEHEGRPVDLRVVDRAYRVLRKRHKFLLVEGVGGLLVPICKEYTVLDLIQRFGLPVLVVARLGLGTINHALLTVQRLQEAKVPVAGVLLNRTTAGRRTPAERTNPATLRRLLSVPVWGGTYSGSPPRFDQRFLNSLLSGQRF